MVSWDCYFNTQSLLYIFAANTDTVKDSTTKTNTTTTTTREKEKKQIGMFAIRTTQVRFTKDTLQHLLKAELGLLFQKTKFTRHICIKYRYSRGNLDINNINNNNTNNNYKKREREEGNRDVHNTHCVSKIYKRYPLKLINSRTGFAILIQQVPLPYLHQIEIQ